MPRRGRAQASDYSLEHRTPLDQCDNAKLPRAQYARTLTIKCLCLCSLKCLKSNIKCSIKCSTEPVN